jgi:hypothetical protein
MTPKVVFKERISWTNCQFRSITTRNRQKVASTNPDGSQLGFTDQNWPWHCKNLGQQNFTHAHFVRYRGRSYCTYESNIEGTILCEAFAAMLRVNTNSFLGFLRSTYSCCSWWGGFWDLWSDVYWTAIEWSGSRNPKVLKVERKSCRLMWGLVMIMLSNDDGPQSLTQFIMYSWLLLQRQVTI